MNKKGSVKKSVGQSSRSKDASSTFNTRLGLLLFVCRPPPLLYCLPLLGIFFGASPELWTILSYLEFGSNLSPLNPRCRSSSTAPLQSRTLIISHPLSAPVSLRFTLFSLSQDPAPKDENPSLFQYPTPPEFISAQTSES